MTHLAVILLYDYTFFMYLKNMYRYTYIFMRPIHFCTQIKKGQIIGRGIQYTVIVNKIEPRKLF